MTARHTPGPWYCEQQRPGQQFTAIGEPIAVVGGEATSEDVEFVIGRTCDFGPHGDEQTAANARLIAAAPELLAALEAIHAAMSQPVQFTASHGLESCTVLRGDACLARNMARVVIAKAMGEQSQ